MLVSYSFAFYFFIQFLWLGTVELKRPKYSIVKLNYTFTGPNDSWSPPVHKYRRCNNDLVDSCVTIRLDNVTSQWNLTDDSVNDLVAEEYFHSTSKLHVFKPEFFLNLARNLNISFVGDSQSQQIHEGLVNRLRAYCPRAVFLDKTNSKMSTHCEAYNTTISFVRSNYLYVDERLQHLRGEGVLFVGAGAWFKPLQPQLQYMFNGTYNASEEWSIKYYRNCTDSFRRYVLTHYPSAKVVWRLIPHVGRMDELRLLQNMTDLDLHDGEMWSHSSMGAHWVPGYNDRVEQLAARYGDRVIDCYTLSNQYLDYFASMKFWMHVDPAHYCTTGYPRGNALLVQDALYDIIHESVGKASAHHLRAGQ